MAKCPYDCLKFVWRQSEFAFFGALTSVGALFYFILGGIGCEEKIVYFFDGGVYRAAWAFWFGGV